MSGGSAGDDAQRERQDAVGGRLELRRREGREVEREEESSTTRASPPTTAPDIAGAESQAMLEIDPATQAISAETASYDVVVSFQVLEHSSHRLALLRECRRVLRPNGVLMLTLPFVFEYHAVPGDFRRWTTEGITEDLQDCGYADVVAEPIETDLHSLLVVNELFVSRHLGYVATKPLFLALNLAALAAAKLKAPAHRILPLTLGVVARRPA
jgi:SAM-dependent methyltransferase